MKPKTILLCLSLSYSCITFGQNPGLRGRVFDARSNKPIRDASVQVSGTELGRTDEHGNFTITCPDTREITITSYNYAPYKQAIADCNSEFLAGLTPLEETLEEVEITATSSANKTLLHQPNSVVKLTAEELKRNNGLFLDDAINGNVPGVLMERRTVSAGQQFNIRGYGNGARGTNGISSNFDSQGIKVYLNGIPITDAEGITLMDDIDFNSVDHVEVLKGPAGYLYGQAIAGVVNLKTKEAGKDKTSIGQNVLFGSYGLRRYTTSVELGSANSSLLLNYGKQYCDGFMVHTASEKDFVNFSGQFKVNRKQLINTYVGYSKSYDQRGGELTIGQYDTLNYSGNTTYIKNNAHSQIISFRAGVSNIYNFNKFISNTTTLFGSGVNNNAASAAGTTDKLPLNYGVRSTIDVKIELNDKYTLSGVFGGEFQEQDATTIGYAMVADSTNLQGYNIIGSMRSNQATITRNSTLFTDWTLAMPYDIQLSAGAGLSNMYIELNDRFYVASNNKPNSKLPTSYSTFYGNMLAPHVAINKVFSKKISLYASYSVGYKAPVSSYFFIPATGVVNKDLKPEVGTQYEIGTKGTLLKDKLQYQLAVFDAVFDNKMTAVAVPLNSVTTAYSYVANGGRQNNKGIEVALKYSVYESASGFFRSVRPFANFCYSDFKYEHFKFQTLNAARTQVIETDFSGKPVAGVSPLTANVGLDLQVKYGLYGNVNYNYRDAMNFTSDGLNKTKAFGLLNAKIGVHRTIFKHLDIDLFFGANNILSTQYYYMVFLNQLPDAYMPAPNKINYYGGANLKYIF